jgi:hypothetical protein
MPRNYSEKFLIAVNKFDVDSLGVKLAKACVKANLPATFIADAFGVSRMTIHSWFRGKPIRDKNSKRVKEVLKIIDLGIINNTLPATTMQGAKNFADDLKEALSTAQ